MTTTYVGGALSSCQVIWTMRRWHYFYGVSDSPEENSFRDVTDFSAFNGESAVVTNQSSRAGEPDVQNYELDGTLYVIYATDLKSGKSASTNIATTNQELAGRLAKAVNHAIELCGGKPEPF